MRKRRKALVWIFAGFSIVIALFLVSTQPSRRDNQPAYRGRTLAQWLDVGAHGANRVWGPRADGKGPTTEEIHEAEESIRAIGTNALPSLLSWISYEPSRPKVFYRGVVDVLPLPEQARTFLSVTVTGYKHENLSDLAVLGFAILNTNALPAREQLSKLASSTKDAGRQQALGKVVLTITNTPTQ